MRILYLPNSYSQQRQREKKANIYPVRMAMEAEWHRQHGCYVQWGGVPFEEYGPWDKVIYEPEGMRFLELPRPDRVFTRAKEYTSGNYKYLPGTHIMSASGCSHGKCVFCVENNKPYETRQVSDVIGEINECKALGFKEVFDDSATFPTGDWLEAFLDKIMVSGISIRIGANVRIGGTYDFRTMRKAGFRLLLFGVESANQYTLDKINKGVKVEDIEPTIRKASEAGLEPHIAVMLGFPWETDADAERTIKLVHRLLRRGYAKTAQASFYTCTGQVSNESQRKYVKKIYNVGFDPRFWWVRRNEDISYLWRGVKAWLG